jgi:hypothetical protein
MPNVRSSAAAPAAAAHTAAAGSSRFFVASQHAPAAAKSGHFTHQAETSTNTAVSGPHRTRWATSIAALSSSAS